LQFDDRVRTDVTDAASNENLHVFALCLHFL
jgi:hypothetical protein